MLALANEHGVRSALQARQPPILLHATTGPNGRAQLHRHIAGRDDCINCRLPEEAPVLGCAEGPLTTKAETDAALPFLSACAALLLLAALIRLQLGELDTTPLNYACLGFDQPSPTFQDTRQLCRDGCTRWASPAVRKSITAGERFSHLDPARAI